MSGPKTLPGARLRASRCASGLWGTCRVSRGQHSEIAFSFLPLRVLRRPTTRSLNGKPTVLITDHNVKEGLYRRVAEALEASAAHAQELEKRLVAEQAARRASAARMQAEEEACAAKLVAVNARCSHLEQQHEQRAVVIEKLSQPRSIPPSPLANLRKTVQRLRERCARSVAGLSNAGKQACGVARNCRRALAAIHEHLEEACTCRSGNTAAAATAAAF